MSKTKMKPKKGATRLFPIVFVYMDPLYQRLKELDPDTFHKLCLHLLKDRHPNSAFHQIEGTSGDEGIDFFEGELGGELTIFQCKSFPNGIGESQKGQIRESLNTALRSFSPKNWILCLSVNLDAKAARWWEKYKKSKSNIVRIGELFASQIVHELVYRRTIRNYFFPNVAMDPVEFKRLLTGSGELTTEQLESVTEANLEDYIERLKEHDARFNYELVFSGDLGPETITSSKPGLMMSMRDGAKTLNVFARDADALRLDPPTLNLQFSGGGVEKIRELIKTGKAQTFQDSEFKSLGSNVALFDLSEKSDNKGTKLIVGPTPSFLNQRIKSRVTFANGTQEVEYGFIEFAPVRAGTDEIEFKTVSEALPFELRLTLRVRAQAGRLQYVPRFIGSEIRQVDKFINAIELLHSGATVTVWDAEREVQLLALEKKEGRITDEQRAAYGFIGDLRRIADRFNLCLRLPKELSDSDFETVSFLRDLMNGIEYASDSATFSLTKSDSNKEIIENLQPVTAFRIVHDAYEPKPILFGQEVNTGSVAFTISRAEIVDYKATRSRFKSARIGDVFPFKLRPQVPIKLELLNRNA
jgi:hypothetical protein